MQNTPNLVTKVNSSQNKSQDPKTRIKLLTYNIFLRTPLINNNGDDYKNERCKLIIEELDSFDIICFQELFGLLNSRKIRIQNKAFKKGFLYQAQSPNPGFFSGALVDGGLVTLSRYPIAKHKFQPFPYGVLADNLSLKGVLYTQIDINGNTIHLFNSHFQASYVGIENNIRATLVTRIDQLKCYKKFMNKMLEESYHLNDLVLLAGDFNVDGLHEGYSSKVFSQSLLKQNSIQVTNLNDLYKEYDAMIQILSHQQNDQIIDLIRTQNNNISMTTYGDIDISPAGIKIASEVILTDPDDLKCNQCLDYIMQFIRSPSKIHESKLIVRKDSLRVEKFKVSNQIFTQLSDHYGISCEINTQNQ